jgi:biopolymer transport protein ExbD
MAGSLNDDDPITDINVTPFVDVVLVLLVIFMVTAGFIVNRGVKIELPQAATAEQLANQKTFNILVTPDGETILDGAKVSRDELAAAGRTAIESGEKVVAMIGADKGVIYSYVVGVMDTLRGAGVNDFALQLEPMPTNEKENPSPTGSTQPNSKTTP